MNNSGTSFTAKSAQWAQEVSGALKAAKIGSVSVETTCLGPIVHASTKVAGGDVSLVIVPNGKNVKSTDVDLVEVGMSSLSRNGTASKVFTGRNASPRTFVTKLLALLK